MSKSKYLLTCVTLVFVCAVLMFIGFLTFRWLNNPERLLIGSWGSCKQGYMPQYHQNNVYTFYKDGTLIIDTPTSSYAGEYFFVTKNRIRYNLASFYGGIYQVDFGNSGDYLNLTLMKGDEFAAEGSLCFLRVGSKLYEDDIVRRQDSLPSQ